jgi:hypothetical protein
MGFCSEQVPPGLPSNPKSLWMVDARSSMMTMVDITHTRFCIARALQGSCAYSEREWQDIAEGHWRNVMGMRLSSVGVGTFCCLVSVAMFVKLQTVLIAVGIVCCTGTYLGEADESTDEKVIQGICLAINRGVNVIDTAINYRGQRGERAVGTALHLCLEVRACNHEALSKCVPLELS